MNELFKPRLLGWEGSRKDKIKIDSYIYPSLYSMKQHKKCDKLINEINEIKLKIKKLIWFSLTYSGIETGEIGIYIDLNELRQRNTNDGHIIQLFALSILDKVKKYDEILNTNSNILNSYKDNTNINININLNDYMPNDDMSIIKFWSKMNNIKKEVLFLSNLCWIENNILWNKIKLESSKKYLNNKMEYDPLIIRKLYKSYPKGSRLLELLYNLIYKNEIALDISIIQILLDLFNKCLKPLLNIFNQWLFKEEIRLLPSPRQSEEFTLPIRLWLRKFSQINNNNNNNNNNEVLNELYYFTIENIYPISFINISIIDNIIISVCFILILRTIKDTKVYEKNQMKKLKSKSYLNIIKNKIDDNIKRKNIDIQINQEIDLKNNQKRELLNKNFYDINKKIIDNNIKLNKEMKLKNEENIINNKKKIKERNKLIKDAKLFVSNKYHKLIKNLQKEKKINEWRMNKEIKMIKYKHSLKKLLENEKNQWENEIKNDIINIDNIKIIPVNKININENIINKNTSIDNIQNIKNNTIIKSNEILKNHDDIEIKNDINNNVDELKNDNDIKNNNDIDNDNELKNDNDIKNNNDIDNDNELKNDNDNDIKDDNDKENGIKNEIEYGIKDDNDKEDGIKNDIENDIKDDNDNNNDKDDNNIEKKNELIKIKDIVKFNDNEIKENDNDIKENDDNQILALPFENSFNNYQNILTINNILDKNNQYYNDNDTNQLTIPIENSLNNILEPFIEKSLKIHQNFYLSLVNDFFLLDHIYCLRYFNLTIGSFNDIFIELLNNSFYDDNLNNRHKINISLINSYFSNVLHSIYPTIENLEYFLPFHNLFSYQLNDNINIDNMNNNNTLLDLINNLIPEYKLPNILSLVCGPFFIKVLKKINIELLKWSFIHYELNELKKIEKILLLKINENQKITRSEIRKLKKINEYDENNNINNNNIIENNFLKIYKLLVYNINYIFYCIRHYFSQQIEIIWNNFENNLPFHKNDKNNSYSFIHLSKLVNENLVSSLMIKTFISGIESEKQKYFFPELYIIYNNFNDIQNFIIAFLNFSKNNIINNNITIEHLNELNNLNKDFKLLIKNLCKNLSHLSQLTWSSSNLSFDFCNILLQQINYNNHYI